MTDAIRLDTLHLNDGSFGLPKNPRFIRDERFRALCRSVAENPEYMPARPIIVNEAGVILGGNMRYRACLENGLVEVPASWVQRVEGWPLEKQKRFIVLDNRGFGEDDMDALANEWDVEDLIAAGFTEEELTGGQIEDGRDGDKAGASPWDRVGDASDGVMFVFGEIQCRVSFEAYERFKAACPESGITAWIEGVLHACANQ